MAPLLMGGEKEQKITLIVLIVSLPPLSPIRLDCRQLQSETYAILPTPECCTSHHLSCDYQTVISFFNYQFVLSTLSFLSHTYFLNLLLRLKLSSILYLPPKKLIFNRYLATPLFTTVN